MLSGCSTSNSSSSPQSSQAESAGSVESAEESSSESSAEKSSMESSSIESSTNSTTESSAAKEESSGNTVAASTGSKETVIDLSKGSATIEQSGTYRLNGSLKDGSITVNVDKTTDEGLVSLILDNASISSSTGTPINIIEAKDVRIELADGTVNTVSQGAISTDDTEFPSAAIYSKADLVIAGTGTLNVTTEYNDCISGRDDLVIEGGILNLKAAADGIVGKDSLTVKDGTIVIEAGKKGMRSTNTEAADLGLLTISGGSIDINAVSEGLEGISVSIEGGSINIVAEDDGINVSSNTGTLYLSGGEIDISSGGDGIDSNGNIEQSGGSVVINTQTVGPQDTPLDYDGSYTKTGGSIKDQNGSDIDTSMQGPGGMRNNNGMGGMDRGGKAQGNTEFPAI